MAKSLGRDLGRLLAQLWRTWTRAAQALCGTWEWDAPQWMARLGIAAAQGRAAGVEMARRRPRTVAIGLGSALALMVGGTVLWHWYSHLPQPESASFTVTPPERTRIEREGAKPDPLLVRFDRSVAPLALVGKTVPGGITLRPALPGTWRWLDDRVLEFRSRDDWPVGQRFDVTFDKGAVAPQIRLERYAFEFASASFGARLATAEFYQDPVNPGVKFAVFDLEFTHPVDAAELERRIELRLAGQKTGVLGVGRESIAFSVVYDKLKLHASIHSASLSIPKNPTTLELKVDSGVRAARGGNLTARPLTATAQVPGLYSLSIEGIEPMVVANARNEPEQVLLLNLSAATGEREVASAVKAWVLPAVRPADALMAAAGTRAAPYVWSDPREVNEAVLAQSNVLVLEPIAAEREFVETHSFRYHADVGRFVLVQVDKNLRSFGGYLSARSERFIVRVPPFPPELKILSQGALLALSGDHKVAALVRDVPGVRIDIARVLPAQLQHWVSQSGGDFANPTFVGNFGPDNLTERSVRKIPLGELAHGQSHYETIDFSDYLKSGGTDKRGVFLLTLRSYDPNIPPDDADEDDGMGDQRLVLVTDLGIVLKRSADGSQDVFVQSIASGLPVAGASVDLIAKNGTTLLSQPTDVEGRAHFLKIDHGVRERAPLMVQVQKAGDLSFLPLNHADRTLDLSRFDVGGVHSAHTATELHAYLFTDRGIYRPGDTLHVGMIAKTADWSADLAGIPLEAELIDARGLTAERLRFKLPAGGFAEFSHLLPDTAPTGTYTVNLYIVKDDRPDAEIGTATLRVQEFEPDRMKVSAHLSAESLDGWVSPLDLKATVNVQNLFGTAAEHRRVEAELTLTPAFPAFRALPDYRFYDPLRAKEGYSDKLAEIETDTQGNAHVDLGLQKYARATYRVHLLARAFEPAGGRSVTADAAVLVSDMPFLVGFKADGDLEYIARSSKRVVSWVAIDPNVKPQAAEGLKLLRVESQFVSVLTKQPNGTYLYESRKKDITLSEEPFALPAAGLRQTLATDVPGTFAYVIRDAAGLELNRVEYSVVGQANLTRSLERNAELQIQLNKKDYAPGEEIELSIKAPYTGAGLITIEREHVFATRWFKTETTASVQKIRIPADFEGNGYVSVQFTRDAKSDEIFTSPLSYGVAPFATRLAARNNALTLNVPELVKPGERLHIELKSEHATRAVVFAVDDGILQVARYATPDPLGEFFKKRALEVTTSQILDLILPEFKRVLAAAAPGGDGEAALRRNLNPFKRKHVQPAVYWSGIVDVEHGREFTWTVPDSFNGSLKVFAVAVNEGAIGVAQAATTVRGDFVLTPNMPVAVAPGDEFEVSVGVANGVAGSGNAAVQVSAELPPQLESLGAAQQSMSIAEHREAVVLFRFRAKALLGNAPVRFTARWQDHAAQLVSDVSVRPASPYVTEILAGSFGNAVDVPIRRSLYPDFRKLNAAVSALPLVLVGGLADYLDDYPHLCTEQLVSRGFPALVIAHRPELARADAKKRPPADATAALVAVLRSRQNAEGGFGLWSASIVSDDFASVYAMHWMIDAREQGQAIPLDLYRKGLDWLQRYAASPVADRDLAGLAGLRNRAHATYLLTRTGMVTTPIVSSLRETLVARYPNAWRGDAAAAYLAAVYQLQHQDREAKPLIQKLAATLGSSSGTPFAYFDDDTIRGAQVLYLLSRHFPERARALGPDALQALVAPLARGQYNTLSAAYLAIAFDAYAADAPGGMLNKFTATQGPAGGKASALDLHGELILRGTYGADSAHLTIANETGMAGFFAITNAGFDREPPLQELREGLEIQREYLNAKGDPVTTLESGEEVTVRLRVRSTERSYIWDVAITDLLPGGFEPVLNDAAVTDGAWTDRLGGGAWRPQFADIREDRVVLYGMLSKDMAEYRYRIRATNAGSFLVPPSYAESMYDRTLRARASASRVTVVRPRAH